MGHNPGYERIFLYPTTRTLGVVEQVAQEAVQPPPCQVFRSSLDDALNYLV